MPSSRPFSKNPTANPSSSFGDLNALGDGSSGYSSGFVSFSFRFTGGGGGAFRGFVLGRIFGLLAAGTGAVCLEEQEQTLFKRSAAGSDKVLFV